MCHILANFYYELKIGQFDFTLVSKIENNYGTKLRSYILVSVVPVTLMIICGFIVMSHCLEGLLDIQNDLYFLIKITFFIIIKKRKEKNQSALI